AVRFALTRKFLVTRSITIRPCSRESKGNLSRTSTILLIFMLSDRKLESGALCLVTGLSAPAIICNSPLESPDQASAFHHRIGELAGAFFCAGKGASACYPFATRPDFGVAAYVNNHDEIGITCILEVRDVVNPQKRTLELSCEMSAMCQKADIQAAIG